MRLTTTSKATALAALALAGLFTPSAQATISAATDDIFIGFRQVGNSTHEYGIDIGQASVYRDAIAPITLALTGLNTDMGNAFGGGTASWKTSGDLLWGAAAATGAAAVGNDDIRTLYVSEPAGTTVTAQIDQSGPSNNIAAYRTGYFRNQTAGSVNQSVSGVGTVVGTVGTPNSSTSWVHFAPTSFVDSNNIAPFESVFNHSFVLYRIPQTQDQSQITTVGTFTFNIGTGVNESSILFTPAVPEPGTLALFGMAALSLGFRRSRRPLA